MTDILICGAGGKMGRVVAELAAADAEHFRVVAGVDKFAAPEGFSFPLFRSAEECDVRADAVVDFSRPDALGGILAYCRKFHCGAVLATTGYTPEQKEEIARAAKEIALFQTFNLSLGIALLESLVKKASEFLGESFEVEIVEKHHDQKVDAPSGTALMLAAAVSGHDEKDFVFGRQGSDAKRTPREIGIHAVRGGTVVGEHDVLFLGHDEEITLSHRAQSKAVFAQGALRAAGFLKGKPAGKYNMDDYIEENFR